MPLSLSCQRRRISKRRGGPFQPAAWTIEHITSCRPFDILSLTHDAAAAQSRRSVSCLMLSLSPARGHACCPPDAFFYNNSSSYEPALARIRAVGLRLDDCISVTSFHGFVASKQWLGTSTGKHRQKLHESRLLGSNVKLLQRVEALGGAHGRRICISRG